MAIHKYQAFVRVAEMGSITKAAEAMGYTQSAVSRMVADLEDEWNLNLLRRSRGGLALSSDGLMLLPYIKDLCSHYEALQEQANSLKGLETGFIRIGSCSSFSTQCLPSILKNFEQRYPRIVFQLQNMEYSETEEALCAGEIDCGFISAPYSPELDVTVLLRDRMLAVLPPDHPLADAPSYPLKRFSAITSDFAKSVSVSTYSAISSPCGVGRLPDARIFIPRAFAMRPVVCPIFPKPIMPIVFPASSISGCFQ